jgi:predicted Zn-dependent protease
MLNDETFWLDCVRSLGSNSATDGFASLEELVRSDKLDARQLRRLASACRSLMDAAKDKAAEAEDRVKRPYAYK